MRATDLQINKPAFRHTRSIYESEAPSERQLYGKRLDGSASEGAATGASCGWIDVQRVF